MSSGGLKVLANLAYALAHQLTALDLGLPLPGMLMIDGITKNVGRDEYDRAWVEAVFDTLRQIGAEHGERCSWSWRPMTCRRRYRTASSCASLRMTV